MIESDIFFFLSFPSFLFLFSFFFSREKSRDTQVLPPPGNVRAMSKCAEEISRSHRDRRDGIAIQGARIDFSNMCERERDREKYITRLLRPSFFFSLSRDPVVVVVFNTLD